MYSSDREQCKAVEACFSMTTTVDYVTLARNTAVVWQINHPGQPLPNGPREVFADITRRCGKDEIEHFKAYVEWVKLPLKPNADVPCRARESFPVYYTLSRHATHGQKRKLKEAKAQRERECQRRRIEDAAAAAAAEAEAAAAAAEAEAVAAAEAEAAAAVEAEAFAKAAEAEAAAVAVMAKKPESDDSDLALKPANRSIIGAVTGLMSTYFPGKSFFVEAVKVSQLPVSEHMSALSMSMKEIIQGMQMSESEERQKDAENILQWFKCLHPTILGVLLQTNEPELGGCDEELQHRGEEAIAALVEFNNTEENSKHAEAPFFPWN
jgi:hypothetical protein